MVVSTKNNARHSNGYGGELKVRQASKNRTLVEMVGLA